ncbi:TetR/AcrR family transcriptional regulator [Catenulispora rubra]|uniref:TetR/AcrR family transcriptional regulator n=1 Tax=Catenulispora rubra TaxID=280293 RepID=UPI00189265C8|nr:TetR family transcriptional regulator [Catenulispora rubra]
MSTERDSRVTAGRAGPRRATNGYAAGQATRVRLIESAEALFAERGVAGVSLNEVRTAAGQSNAAAVNYHFGSKENLIKAILEHRLTRIESDRAEMLRALDSEGRTGDVRGLLEALIEPQAHSIERNERYVGFISQLVIGESGWFSEYTLLMTDPGLIPGGLRIDRLLHARLGHLPEPVADRRLMFVYAGALQALARHQLHRDSGEAPPTPLFVSELIDMLSATLTAPVSEQTRDQLAAQSSSVSAPTS